MVERVERRGMQVDAALATFIEDRALPGTGIAADGFWAGLSEAVHGMGAQNRALLERRAELQQQIDAWHRARKGQPVDPGAYRAFLEEIGYLLPEGEPFTIDTTGIDPEIASVPGPQLVVPIMNALNAANARWGSLYDALYGTDALGTLPVGRGYDAARGARVIAWGRAFLDDIAPLVSGSWADVTELWIEDGGLFARADDVTGLMDPAQFAGFGGDAADPDALVLRNNGLHLILDRDAAHPIGGTDRARIADIRVESAMSSIMDCEDSVAAVDGEDKVLAYSNWLDLMTGTLRESLKKNGRRILRELNPDLKFTGRDGAPLTLKARALMLVRNVGHLMTTPAILDRDGNEAFEGIVDAFCTTLCAMHDLAKGGAREGDSGRAVCATPPPDRSTW